MPKEKNIPGTPTWRKGLYHSAPWIEGDYRHTIIGVPGYGNEPYLMFLRIAKEWSKLLIQDDLEPPKIVVPLVYGLRQKQIMLAENNDDPSLIYCDEVAGDIIKDLMFSGSYKNHLLDISNYALQADGKLNYRYAWPTFKVRSLATNQVSGINANILATIDTGSRVSIMAPNRYAVFPGLLSEFLTQAIGEGMDLGVDIQSVERIIRKLESTYDEVFVPRINTLSFNYANLDDQPNQVNNRTRIYTPPLREELKPTYGRVDQPGIYVMYSGTSAGYEENRAVIGAIQEAGLTAYIPHWADLENSSAEIGQTVRAEPDIISDEQILAVYARAGWGTVWQTQQLEKPILVPPVRTDEDPEMVFNTRTIERHKLGIVFEPGQKFTNILFDSFEEVRANLRDHKRQNLQRFGTNDGVKYAAQAIHGNFCSRINEVIQS